MNPNWNDEQVAYAAAIGVLLLSAWLLYGSLM